MFGPRFDFSLPKLKNIAPWAVAVFVGYICYAMLNIASIIVVIVVLLAGLVVFTFRRIYGHFPARRKQ